MRKTNEELADQYGVDVQTIEEVVERYGSFEWMENRYKSLKIGKEDIPAPLRGRLKENIEYIPLEITIEEYSAKAFHAYANLVSVLHKNERKVEEEHHYSDEGGFGEDYFYGIEEVEKDHYFYSIDSVENLLNRLSKKERDIIKERFGLDAGIEKTTDEIHEKLNLTSKEAVERMEKKAFKKMNDIRKRGLLKITGYKETKEKAKALFGFENYHGEYAKYYNHEYGGIELSGMDFSEKTHNGLRSIGAENLQDIIKMKPEGLKRLKGKGVYDEVISMLENYGVTVTEEGEFTYEKEEWPDKNILGYTDRESAETKADVLFMQYEIEMDKFMKPEYSIFKEDQTRESAKERENDEKTILSNKDKKEELKQELESVEAEICELKEKQVELLEEYEELEEEKDFRD